MSLIDPMTKKNEKCREMICYLDKEKWEIPFLQWSNNDNQTVVKIRLLRFTA